MIFYIRLITQSSKGGFIIARAISVRCVCEELQAHRSQNEQCSFLTAASQGHRNCKATLTQYRSKTSCAETATKQKNYCSLNNLEADEQLFHGSSS